MEYLPAEEEVDPGSRFAAYRPALLAYARCLAGSVSDADDLVQATLLAAIEHAGQLAHADDPRPWLFTILRNRFHRGARQREVLISDEEWSHLAVGAGWAARLPDPFAQAASLERTRQLESSFLMLEGEDREILLLRDIEEISGEQTANLLGLTITAMKSRLHRARLRLLAAMRRAGAVAPGKSLALSCLEVLQCLPHYADQSLSPQAKAAVEQHVAVCQACAHFGRRYADILQALPLLSHGGGTGA